MLSREGRESLRTCPAEVEERGTASEQDPEVYSSAKHKFKDKIIKNFRGDPKSD